MKEGRPANLRPALSGLGASVSDFVGSEFRRHYGSSRSAISFVRRLQQLLEPVLRRESVGILHNSHLCLDGQPLELSLSISSTATDLRYVIDTTDPRLSLPQRWRSYRAVAETVVPEFDGQSGTLDHLFLRHERGTTTRYRFQVWHGAGYSRTAGPVGKLYFNTAWLTNDALAGIVSDVVDDTPGSLLEELLAGQNPIDFVCYDFCGRGLTAIKLYRFFGMATLESAHPAIQSPVLKNRIAGIVDTLSACHMGKQRGEFFLKHSYGSTGELHKVSLDIALYRYDILYFEELLPILDPLFQKHMPGAAYERVVNRIRPDFRPTVVTVACSHDMNSCSLYFKPNLDNSGPTVRCRF